MCPLFDKIVYAGVEVAPHLGTRMHEWNAPRQWWALHAHELVYNTGQTIVDHVLGGEEWAHKPQG